MKKFTTFTGKTAYLPWANIDTDQIIPKLYLKTIKRTGLGQYLFADLRYTLAGQRIDDFILNQQPDTEILITGENFGCGSSREHAPWAIVDFGIRVIIAPSFADIFYNNCFKNGILPIKLAQQEIDLMHHQPVLTINLLDQIIQSENTSCYFAIDEHRKEILLQGLDDIEKVLQIKNEIIAFEKQYFDQYPWLRGEA